MERKSGGADGGGMSLEVARVGRLDVSMPASSLTIQMLEPLFGHVAWGDDGARYSLRRLQEYVLRRRIEEGGYGPSQQIPITVKKTWAWADRLEHGRSGGMVVA